MMAVTSAWNTGQPVSSTRFWPRPMISPSLTITAPNGPPQPFSTELDREPRGFFHEFALLGGRRRRCRRGFGRRSLHSGRRGDAGCGHHRGAGEERAPFGIRQRFANKSLHGTSSGKRRSAST